MNHREQELIQAAKDGDNRSFDELVRLYDSRILQVAHGIMQDAYDAYQEGVIRAYLNLNSFRSDSSFGTWLTRIVINQALNMKKKLRWKQRLSLEQLQEVAPAFLEDSSATPDEVYVTNELSASTLSLMEGSKGQPRNAPSTDIGCLPVAFIPNWSLYEWGFLIFRVDRLLTIRHPGCVRQAISSRHQLWKPSSDSERTGSTLRLHRSRTLDG